MGVIINLWPPAGRSGRPARLRILLGFCYGSSYPPQGNIFYENTIKMLIFMHQNLGNIIMPFDRPLLAIDTESSHLDYLRPFYQEILAWYAEAAFLDNMIFLRLLGDRWVNKYGLETKAVDDKDLQEFPELRGSQTESVSPEFSDIRLHLFHQGPDRAVNPLDLLATLPEPGIRDGD